MNLGRYVEAQWKKDLTKHPKDCATYLEVNEELVEDFKKESHMVRVLL